MYNAIYLYKQHELGQISCGAVLIRKESFTAEMAKASIAMVLSRIAGESPTSSCTVESTERCE